ncbi:hypothetical protein OIU78_006630 [Salix suchowensis]|nr:hypothetical protein OIU78_006630 [Salix suchowensis]
MSILWEKSGTWRWMVRKTRDSKPFFFTFATVCGVVPGVIGYFVMQTTNSSNPEIEARLRQNASPDSLMMGKVNQERLAEYLGRAAAERGYKRSLCSCSERGNIDKKPIRENSANTQAGQH